MNADRTDHGRHRAAAGRLNMAYEAVDRHLGTTRADEPALRWLRMDGPDVTLTYAELAAAGSKVADVLNGLGIGRGTRVCVLLGRCPDLYAVYLGVWKSGAVVVPLFPAFGPEPVRERITIAAAEVLVTSSALYRRRIVPIRDALTSLRHVLLTDSVPAGASSEVLDLPAAMSEANADVEAAGTTAEDMALLHFTSGTTGRPKGAIHVHGAILAHRTTAAEVLDLHAGDLYWCTADPGWVTGMSYGVLAPLALGATVISDEAEFDARRWYEILSAQRVAVWYTAPTALRMLRRRGDALPFGCDLSSLRLVASVGEPLDAAVVRWSERVLGRPAHDTWWQTETGAMMIAARPDERIRPGSMGRSLPGVEATVLRRGPDGRAQVHDGAVEFADDDEIGELAIRKGWPSMFRGYWNEPARYAATFAGDWYLSGDLVRRDEQGYYWFVGRADDVIKTAGHLVGPFEVESVLMSHPAVAEAAVVGVPDPVAGQRIKAFVVLRAGHVPSEELRIELLVFNRQSLGAVAARELDFVDALPHTRSGKVVRRVLRARESGIAAGDVSTLEPST
ncbi:acetate--CoA ligase [Nocardia higoensis]|uniref:acetate--CoA ligase n=1 Tax=Nocardia higoensis TaxID=228599 RepID=UPI00031D0288|nr:acetate--CoA ligase [Nocardia higoensis]